MQVRIGYHSRIASQETVTSQIEGTQSSLSDQLLFELEEAPGVPPNDVREISTYVAALQYSLRRLRDDFPQANRLLRETHRVLLAGGRGHSKTPGEFRRSQNWVGGSRPGNAAFVPPPHTAVLDRMTAFERFLHAEDDGLFVLLRAALVHVQFEAIHPFLDGNGRVGRLPIILLLSQASPAPAPSRGGSFRMKQVASTTMEGRRGPGSYAPSKHWSTCPQASLGPSRPSFIGEASSEVLPQVRIHTQRHLGPAPPAPEPRSGTARKTATGHRGPLGRSGCVRKPSETPQVFQVSLLRQPLLYLSLYFKQHRSDY